MTPGGWASAHSGWPRWRVGDRCSGQGLGLYRLDPFPAHALDSYRKATLWPYGVEGVLSHETALDLYELSDVNPAMIHITVPKRYRLRRRNWPPSIASTTKTLMRSTSHGTRACRS